MKYNIDIYLDSKSLIRKYEEKQEIAQEKLKHMVITDTDPFVPMESGYLKNSVHDSLGDGKPRIIYEGPYAHYLYTGYVMEDPELKCAGFITNKGWRSRKGVTKVYRDPLQPLEFKTGMSEWFEHSKNLYSKRWLKEIEKVIKS